MRTLSSVHVNTAVCQRPYSAIVEYGIKRANEMYQKNKELVSEMLGMSQGFDAPLRLMSRKCWNSQDLSLQTPPAASNGQRYFIASML